MVGLCSGYNNSVTKNPNQPQFGKNKGKLSLFPDDLFDYQKENVRKIEEFNGRCLLADSMGLGKTRSILGYLHNRPEAWPVIVICPANVKYGWERECLECLKIRPTILEGRTVPKNADHLSPNNIVILNYDILKDWFVYLKKFRANTLVIDECQKLQNRTTIRTKKTRELSKGISNILALSGTPVMNRPVDLWPAINIIRPDVFGSFFSYGSRYCDRRRMPWGIEYKGATHIPELHRLLKKTCMLRKLKSEVLKDLPEKVRKIVSVHLRCLERYQFASSDFIGWLRQQDTLKAKRAAKALELTRMGYLMRLSARLKLRAVVDWINDFFEKSELDEKLVVFAIHRKMIDVIHRRTNAKSVVVFGGMTNIKKKDAIDQFKKDKKTKLFIGNIEAAGVGIDGLQIASNVAFTEFPWRPADITQAEDRLHRIGTKKTVFVYYLTARDTIEEPHCDLLQKKQEIVSGILDGSSQVDDINIYNELLKHLKKNG